jgi:hypothetical protein
MLVALASQVLLQTFDQPPGVGWDAQEVCGLLECVVVRTGQEDRVSTP